MNEIICKNCGKKFKVMPCRAKRAKFCSLECYHEGQSKELTSHIRNYDIFICIKCGGEFKRVKRKYGKYRSYPKYCSRECYINSIIARESRSRVDETKRKRETRNAKCEICGFQRFIEICHIIPSVLGGGYEPENILFLCPNHHRLFDNQLLTKVEFEVIKDKVNNSFNKYGIPIKYRLLENESTRQDLDGIRTVVFLKNLVKREY